MSLIGSVMVALLASWAPRTSPRSRCSRDARRCRRIGGSRASRPLAGRWSPARRWPVLGDAAPQGLDEVDGPAGHGKALLGLRRHPGLLGLEVRQQRLLIAVAEG